MEAWEVGEMEGVKGYGNGKGMKYTECFVSYRGDTFLLMLWEVRFFACSRGKVHEMVSNRATR